MIAALIVAAVLGCLWLHAVARNIDLTADNRVLRDRLDLALPTGSPTPLHDDLAAARFARQFDEHAVDQAPYIAWAEAVAW